MKRKMFNSKIHRATITNADLAYEGSVTIDKDLLDAADILPHEAIHIWNVSRGTRVETYVLEGVRGSGEVCVNGAAAHQNKPGDIVILATFVELENVEAMKHEPTVVRVDDNNSIISMAEEIAGPSMSLQF